MQGFIVLITPTSVQLAELPVLIRLDFSGIAILLIPPPQIDECHVFSFLHLLMYFGEIGLFIVGAPIVGPGFVPIDQFIDRVIRDPFRKRIRQLFAFFKSAYEVVDSGFACTEFFSEFFVAHTQCIPFGNDALVI